MAARKLTAEEKAAATKVLKARHPGESVTVDDHLDANGQLNYTRVKIQAIPMPKGWKPGDPFPDA